MEKPEIDSRRKYSDDVIASFRRELSGSEPQFPGCTVVISGSFARREASEHSDVDYFILHDEGTVSDAQLETLRRQVNTAIESAKLRPPAAGGAFAEKESVTVFLKNVGGGEDPNQKLTRRMLFMLEGLPLMGQDKFDEVRKRLVADVYAKSDLADHQITRFFLNDLIRYWRTIGVDFEFKTSEAHKPWGTRNLKLAFSRKLLYFSGVLMVAETAQRTPTEKARVLLELSAIDAIARVEKVCGDEGAKALRMYEQFLSKLSDEHFRQLADTATPDRKQQPLEFRDLKNLGQYFSWELDRLLHVVYGSGHPIHHALIF